MFVGFFGRQQDIKRCFSLFKRTDYQLTNQQVLGKGWLPLFQMEITSIRSSMFRWIPTQPRPWKNSDVWKKWYFAYSNISDRQMTNSDVTIRSIIESTPWKKELKISCRFSKRELISWRLSLPTSNAQQPTLNNSKITLNSYSTNLANH